MAPMQSDKFAASGMNMSSMGMDMAPEGQRRFTVGVTLAAGKSGGLDYSAEDFQIEGEGIEKSVPIRDQLEGETVSSGGAISGNLVFQIPEDASDLTLSFKESRPVALDLPPASEEGVHSHDEASPEEGQENSGSSKAGHDH